MKGTISDARRWQGVGLPEERYQNSKPVHGYIGASAVVCRTAESLHLLLREGKYCCKIPLQSNNFVINCYF